QEGLLHGVLGLARRAEEAVGDGFQAGPGGHEPVYVVRGRAHGPDPNARAATPTRPRAPPDPAPRRARARVPPAGPPGGSAPPGPRTAGPRSGGRGVPGRARPRLRSISMSHPDDLLAGIAAMVEADQDSQMSLTVVVSGAVITGRLAPEALWRARVAEVLRDSARLRHFAVPFA